VLDFSELIFSVVHGGKSYDVNLTSMHCSCEALEVNPNSPCKHVVFVCDLYDKCPGLKKAWNAEGKRVELKKPKKDSERLLKRPEDFYVNPSYAEQQEDLPGMKKGFLEWARSYAQSNDVAVPLGLENFGYRSADSPRPEGPLHDGSTATTELTSAVQQQKEKQQEDDASDTPMNPEDDEVGMTWGADEGSTAIGIREGIQPVEEVTVEETIARTDYTSPRTGAATLQQAEVLVQLIRDMVKHGNESQREFLEKEVRAVTAKWSSILPNLGERSDRDRQLYDNVSNKYGNAGSKTSASTDFVSIAQTKRAAQNRQDSVPVDILETANDDPTTISALFSQLGEERRQNGRGAAKRARRVEQQSASQHEPTTQRIAIGSNSAELQKNTVQIHENGPQGGLNTAPQQYPYAMGMIYPIHGPMGLYPRRMGAFSGSFAHPHGTVPTANMFHGAHLHNPNPSTAASQWPQTLAHTSTIDAMNSQRNP
jgi:hypothetical protein